MHHPTDRIVYTTAFLTPVVEHWLEREIAQRVHPMKDRSDDPLHHERMLLPWSYISLLFLGVFFFGGVEAGVLGGSLFRLVFLFTRLTQHVYFYSLNLFRSICPLCHTQQTKCFSGWDVIKHVSLIHIF